MQNSFLEDTLRADQQKATKAYETIFGLHDGAVAAILEKPLARHAR